MDSRVAVGRGRPQLGRLAWGGAVAAFAGCACAVHERVRAAGAAPGRHRARMFPAGLPAGAGRPAHGRSASCRSTSCAITPARAERATWWPRSRRRQRAQAAALQAGIEACRLRREGSGSRPRAAAWPSGSSTSRGPSSRGRWSTGAAGRSGVRHAAAELPALAGRCSLRAACSGGPATCSAAEIWLVNDAPGADVAAPSHSRAGRAGRYSGARMRPCPGSAPHRGGVVDGRGSPARHPARAGCRGRGRESRAKRVRPGVSTCRRRSRWPRWLTRRVGATWLLRNRLTYPVVSDILAGR